MARRIDADVRREANIPDDQVYSQDRLTKLLDSLVPRIMLEYSAYINDASTLKADVIRLRQTIRNSCKNLKHKKKSCTECTKPSTVLQARAWQKLDAKVKEEERLFFDWFVDGEDPATRPANPVMDAIRQFCREKSFDVKQFDCFIKSMAWRFNYLHDNLQDMVNKKQWSRLAYRVHHDLEWIENVHVPGADSAQADEMRQTIQRCKHTYFTYTGVYDRRWIYAVEFNLKPEYGGGGSTICAFLTMRTARKKDT